MYEYLEKQKKKEDYNKCAFNEENVYMMPLLIS